MIGPPDSEDSIVLVDPQIAAVDEECRASMARHGRSFDLARRLLGAAHSRDAARCYAFCREADDLVDEAPDRRTARRAIARLEMELLGLAPARPVVAAWRETAARCEVPDSAARDLVATIQTDARRVRLPTTARSSPMPMGWRGRSG